MTKERLIGLIGWFVDWDDSIPFHYIWTDLDTRYGTKLMWRWRLNSWFHCPFLGHDYYPDHCGRRDHDICAECNNRRDYIEGNAR